ncbi:MAG: hypothetical protein JWM65_85, partial [Sphingomonas bacterium]|nr:hypothetical protein [Sphingomonas bacterium]
MTRIRFIATDGSTREVEAQPG